MNGEYDEGSAVPAGGGGISQEAPPNAAPSMRSWLAVAFASVVWASSTYIVRLLITFGLQRNRF